MSAIIIENISRAFVSGIKKKKKQAVINFSLQIQPGEIFGVIGVNGAGKSSILKMIMGFFPPDSGKILILGKPPLNPKSRSKIGYLPENPYFYDHLSAEELLKFSARASGLNKADTINNSEMFLKRVGLFDVKKQKLRTYSKGMTQRAGICFALVHDPEIVILDEPMSGLDPLGRKMVIDLIADLKSQGKTILFCSHILSDVERICDRVAIMDAGCLQKILTKEQIISGSDTARIIIDKNDYSLNEKLTKIDCCIEENRNNFLINCNKNFVDQVLSACNNANVNIISIDYAANNMEKIFLSTIGHS